MTTRRKPGIGAGIIAGLREAVAYEQGETVGVVVRRVATARSTDVAAATAVTSERVARIRSTLAVSQPVFAGLLNVSPNTVRAWEQGKRLPDGAAVRLLEVAEEHPGWLRKKLRPATHRSA
jgi:putative transcriptional regulator